MAEMAWKDVKISKQDLEKARTNPEVVPPGDFTLPSMNLIWPTVMSAYEQLVEAYATIVPHSPPQAESDLAMGLHCYRFAVRSARSSEQTQRLPRPRFS